MRGGEREEEKGDEEKSNLLFSEKGTPLFETLEYMGFPHIEDKLSQMVENKQLWKRKSMKMIDIIEKLKAKGVEDIDSAVRMSLMTSESS